MSRFIAEALFIGAKEGIKLSLCLFLVLSFLRRAGFGFLEKPLAAGLAAVFVASFAVMTIEVTPALRGGIVGMIGYVFGLLYLFSLAALFHTAGTDLLGPLKPVFENRFFLAVLVFLLTVVYFAPDMAGSSLYLSDLFSMSNDSIMVYAAAGTAFGLSLVISVRFLRRPAVDVSRLLGFAQLLLMLAIIKIVAGGVRGFVEPSLIPSVKAGLMKLTHDVVHQLLVMAMVPDHQILSTTAWEYIGLLFGESIGRWLSLALFALPPAVFLKHHFSEKAPLMTDMQQGALKRKHIRSFRDERLLASAPVIAFLLFIGMTWFAQKDEGMMKLYLPDPQPVTADDGTVSIPIQTPARSLRDGALHKFAVTAERESVRFFIMKKPDGMLVACLDACDICSPDGYGQSPGHVVCIYCNTPIPLDTVGKPGGCNPIPLGALVTDTVVQLRLEEIIEKWRSMKSGKTREVIGR